MWQHINMKKILLLLVVFIATLSLSAQVVVNGTKANKVFEDGSDTIVAATSQVFFIPNLDEYHFSYSVFIKDHSGGNTAALAIAGSIDGENYKTLATDNYYGVGSDTAFIKENVSSYTTYPYLKFTVTPSDSMLLKRIDLLILK